MQNATKLGVLGTSVVGRTLAAKLAELRHSVMVGTRDPAVTLARPNADSFGNPPFKVWREQHPGIEVGTFSQAAAYGEMVVNATSGMSSLDALSSAGHDKLAGKILIDVANPLDFSRGMPPNLSVCNTDSLGEQIQRAFPKTSVVKTLNTVNASLMVAPKQLADGAHTMFMCGNDAASKAKVAALLESFGWQDVVDLGDITSARGTEMMLPVWLRAWGALQTPNFSFKLVR
jgi:predicted dinucleotide-binding enzyme